jgi:hypothetical protein
MEYNDIQIGKGNVIKLIKRELIAIIIKRNFYSKKKLLMLIKF